jgi:acetyl esterase/lipase
MRLKAGTVTALIACAGAVALAAFRFQSAGLWAVNLPTVFSGTVIERGTGYGQEAWQRLDIYRPPGREERKRPVIVFFYGGRWTFGAKESYRFAGDAFARRGYITVIPDYNKYPRVRFPAFVEDGAKALTWVYSHIADYGGDRERIFAAGHSAGAHIGALLAADPRYLVREGQNRSAVIRGFAGLAGPYAFTPSDPDLVEIFGPPENYPAMQVTTFIDGTQPPMLLLHGGSDTTVKRYNLDRLEAQIREKGGIVKTAVYPGVGHIWIAGALSRINFFGPPVLDDMLAFFNSIARADN